MTFCLVAQVELMMSTVGEVVSAWWNMTPITRREMTTPASEASNSLLLPSLSTPRIPITQAARYMALIPAVIQIAELAEPIPAI